jgi:peptidoglycan hydrolase CwlO-like protein
MSDVRHFRRRFFGGFDTSDVMTYIEELAAQRNKYKSTGDRLEAELQNLNAEIKRLQGDLDDADRRIMDIKIKSLEEASSGITSLKETYSSIRSEMEVTTYNICNELNKLNNTLSSLSSVLDKTSYRFTELQTLVEHEKADAVSARSARFIH